MRLLSTAGLLVGLILGCSGLEADDDSESTAELTFASYRQCSRDAGYPEMNLYVLSDDGAAHEDWWSLAGKDQLEWGYRTRVRIQSRHNKTWNHTSRRVDAVLSAEPQPGMEFRIQACGGAFLGADGRSFLDGKPIECASPAVCEALDARRADPSDRFDMILRHGADVDGPLILIALTDRTCKSALDCGAMDRCCGVTSPPTCTAWEVCPPEQSLD